MKVAVIKLAGREYTVSEGSVIEVPLHLGTPGETLQVEDVLLLRDGDRVEVGRPRVDGARVVLSVESHGLGKKILVFKFKRRKNYKRLRGHRQPTSVLRVQSIEG